MMEAPYHPQPHEDSEEASASPLSEDQYAKEVSERARISPRSQRRISPWAVDLQLKHGTAASSVSRTQRSTSSWKIRMQQRRAVFGGVAVAEDKEEEEDNHCLEENGSFDASEDPSSQLSPQQKALQHVQERRMQKKREAREQAEKRQQSALRDFQASSLHMLTEDDELDEEEEACPDDMTFATVDLRYNEEAVKDECKGFSLIETNRKLVIQELIEVLGTLYVGDQHIVESISRRDPMDEDFVRNRKKGQTKENRDKEIVMKDLAKRVSDIYTKDHHIVESITPDQATKYDDIPTGSDMAEAAILATAALAESSGNDDEETGNTTETIVDEIGQTDSEDTRTLSLREQQSVVEPQQAKDLPLTILKPSLHKDLPRSQFNFSSITNANQTRSKLIEGPYISFDEDANDDISVFSVFTEATIEEIVKNIIPGDKSSKSVDDPKEDDINKQQIFKDNMRKSFLAFEQLIYAKHQIDNDEYDEETVFEEYSIVNDDSKTVITEMTTNEIIQQVMSSPQGRNDCDAKVTNVPDLPPSTAPQDTLQVLQKEMKKSFAAFEALLGDNEFDEVKHGDDEESCDKSFDEFTLEEDTTVPRRVDDGDDEVTVDEAILQKDDDKKVKDSNHIANEAVGKREQRKKEKINHFQNEMKRSFAAFESMLLKQTGDDEEFYDANTCVSEYTVEEIVDQVTAGKDSKLFAKEMQKSFIAFESLLKQGEEITNSKEGASVWDEETIQDNTPGSIVKHPTTPKPKVIGTASTPAGDLAPLSPNLSGASSMVSERSGKSYEDAISLLRDGSNERSGMKYDDAIVVLDADEENPQLLQPKDESHARSSRQSNECWEDEKKDGDSLLQNTQQFLNAIGGMVSFDKGENTESTEPETMSGDMRPGEKPGAKVNSAPPGALPKTPNKKDAEPMLILTRPSTYSPTKQSKFTQQPMIPSNANVFTNSRMFSENGLVLPSVEKTSKHTTPQKNLPVMNVEINNGCYDDDDMTQITFDHSMHETPRKQRPFSTEEEISQGRDETGSTCSSKASKGIADILRRDIWSPDLTIVQSSLEKLGWEAGKGTSYRSYIIKYGGLLGILRAMDMNPTHSGIQLAACRALELLALDPETQMTIGGVGGIPVVASVMQNNSGSVQIQRAAIAALVNISCCQQENIEGVLESTIVSMTKHANDTEVQENSFKVLANLTMDRPERLKELSHRGGLAAMTMALQKPWRNKAEHHEAISLLSMLLRNLAECDR